MTTPSPATQLDSPFGNRNGENELDHGPSLVGVAVFVSALWAQVGDAFAGRFLADGLNLVLAKSLARGDGLTLIHFPDAVPALWVYPLYPTVISLVGWLWPNFPENLTLIQIVDSAFLGLAAWIVSLQARKLDFSRVAAYMAIAFAFTSASILSLAVSPFAEPLFLALAAGAVLLADRGDESSLTAAASGFLAGACAITGPLGIFVVVGIVAAFAARKALKPAATAAFVAAAIMGPWFVWSMTGHDPTGLAAVAVETARQAGEMDGAVTWQGLGPLINLLLQGIPRWVMVVGGPVAAAMFGVGVLAVFRSASAFAIVTCLCTLGAWLHPDAVPRNEWVLFPWFVLLLTFGAWRAWGYARLTRIPVFVAVLALGAAYVPRNVVAVVGREFAKGLENQNEYLDKLALSINAELPEDSIIASDAEAMIHLYSGRVVVPARLGFPNGNLARVYCDAGVAFIVRTNLGVPGAVGEEDLRNLGPTVSSVFELTGGPSLYRFTCAR